MSATGRGAKRATSDYYPTPATCTRRIVERLVLPGGPWLEPSAGEGAIIRAVERRDVLWHAVELRSECIAPLSALGARVEVGDFLTMPIVERFAVALLNPPFLVAHEFVIRCLDVADWVVCLLRLQWLASEKRARWLRYHAPDVYVLPDRPSFTANGKTDMAEYGWFVWPPGGHDRSVGSVEVLPLHPGQTEITVDTERKAS